MDLYLVHFPVALKHVPIETRYPPAPWCHDPHAEKTAVHLDNVSFEETWHAMEELVEAGLVKNIGVCNLSCMMMRDLLNYAKIKPAVH